MAVFYLLLTDDGDSLFNVIPLPFLKISSIIPDIPITHLRLSVTCLLDSSRAFVQIYELDQALQYYFAIFPFLRDLLKNSFGSD